MKIDHLSLVDNSSLGLKFWAKLKMAKFRLNLPLNFTKLLGSNPYEIIGKHKLNFRSVVEV